MSEEIKDSEFSNNALEFPAVKTNEGTGNKNYNFHNCTITINEEGKAIEVLAAKQKAEAEKVAKQMEMSSLIVSEITKVFGKVAESFIKSESKSRKPSAPSPEPIPNSGSKSKKSPVKKATAKKSRKK